MTSTIAACVEIPLTGTDATDAANRARIPVMEADVILESPERRIILDTKFYRDALARGRGSGTGTGTGTGAGTGKLHSGNRVRCYAYLRRHVRLLTATTGHILPGRQQ